MQSAQFESNFTVNGSELSGGKRGHDGRDACKGVVVAAAVCRMFSEMKTSFGSESGSPERRQRLEAVSKPT